MGYFDDVGDECLPPTLTLRGLGLTTHGWQEASVSAHCAFLHAAGLRSPQKAGRWMGRNVILLSAIQAWPKNQLRPREKNVLR